MYNSRKDKYSFKGVGLFSMKKLRFSQNKDILFIFVVYFILHLFMRFISWDDPYFISALEKANYRLFSLLEKRYLCFQSWEIIAVDMGYSMHHLYKLHNQALDICDGILKRDT